MSKLNKFNKFFDKFIYLFLIFSPLLDALTSIWVRNLNLPFSIGTIVRGLFMILAIIWLKLNTKSDKILWLLLMYAILAIMYFFGNGNNIIREIINIFQIFYLPIMMFLFSKYNNDKINDKLIVKIYLIYMTLIIVPSLFKIGYSLTESYSNKVGYFGFFIGGNELSAILVGLSVIALNYVNNSKSYILKIVTYLELFTCVYLIGTKTLFIGIILVLLFIFYRYIRYAYVFKVDKKKKLFIIIPIIFVVLLIGIIPFTPMMKNLKTTFKYYEVNKVTDIFTLKNLDNLVFSKRLSKVKKVNDVFTKGKISTLIYGIGRTEVEKINVTEIDLFDIFYSIGIFGTFIYVLLILYTAKFKSLKDKYNFSLELLFLISLFAGHVLIQPMVSIYIALLYLLSKNSLTLEKKSILLVSNMYPSTKYKHYGSFVRNTEEVLRDNGFIVDRAVMTKKNEKIVKLLAYIKLHLTVILKSIFNNYDYIYVHYVSHSGIGPVIVKKTSTDVKLVFNAHGNDVVIDTDKEKKNIKRSKKYLKYAYKVVVPSKYYKDVMVNDYNISEDKVFVYPSGGVDTNKFVKKDKKEAKKDAGLSTNYNYIGYISRLEQDKGYDTFLEAINKLKDIDEMKNYKYIVVGAGSKEEEFNDIIKKYNLQDYLETRNFLSQDELIDVYNSLDIFVFPTYRKSESLGLVGLEAMACENIVIAAKNYGPTSYIINNKNGLFFKPKDSEDLKDKILKAKNLNQEEEKKIKAKARETAIKYDSFNTRKIILNVFK